MIEFKDLRVGMRITGYSCDNCCPDEVQRVEACGYDWCVFRKESGDINYYVLEPADLNVYHIIEYEGEQGE
jgi:hypothetical protein